MPASFAFAGKIERIGLGQSEGRQDLFMSFAVLTILCRCSLVCEAGQIAVPYDGCRQQSSRKMLGRLRHVILGFAQQSVR